jgi:hypothetical protein
MWIHLTLQQEQQNTKKENFLHEGIFSNTKETFENAAKMSGVLGALNLF